jgi:DNA-binding beta-propeller fold protein YncE
MIQRRTIVRISGGLAAALLVLVVAGWLAFIPSTKGPSYVFVKAWGEKGSGPGQFNDPTGIAIAGNAVFVADSRNGRIQVFDLNGNFKRLFGRPGKKLGELGRPMNITIVRGELYAAEYFNDRVQVFALDGTPKRTIGSAGSGPGRFKAPGGVAVAPNGDLFVADFYNHRVQHLKADGSFIRQWGITGKTGAGAGEFIYPTDVAVAPDGVLYVADGYADRIQAFDRHGKFLRKWGGPFATNIFGPFNGWFAVTTAVTVSPQGNIFVADFYNDRVQNFTRDGIFLSAFGSKGNGPGQFGHAMSVAVAADGSVFVVDFQNNRIQKWQPQNKFDYRAAHVLLAPTLTMFKKPGSQ